MSGVPPCGSPEFLKVLSTLPSGVNIPAAKTAAAYVETQLDPIKAEMESQVEGIAIVIVLILFFFIVLPLLVYIIWIGYELEISAAMMLALIVVYFIVAIFVILFVVSSVGATISSVLNTATSQLITLDNPQTVVIVTSAVNGAAAQYLQAINKPC